MSKRLMALVAVVSVTVLGTACSSDKKKTDSSSSTTSAAAATSAAATTSSAAETSSSAAAETSSPAAVTSSSAAETTSAPAGEPAKIAFITKFPVSFFTAMDDAAKKADEADDSVAVDYFTCKTPTDFACQIGQIEDAVTKKYKAIVITPMGPEVRPAMKKAAAAGVKVMLADNNDSEFPEKTGAFATDNAVGGQKAGAYIKTLLKSGDSIGLMEGVHGNPNLDARIKGVQDALKGTGVKVVVAGGETGCDAAKGATVAEDLLTKNPNLTAIYSACDDPAIAAAKLVKTKGKKIMVIGFDGLPDAAKLIQSGDMQATIAQFPGTMAKLAVEAASKAIKGEKVESFNDTGSEVVTKENAAKFLNFQ
ncbi:MAG: sugar ABC transporter substrate-binding protein [Actinomycetota bacterium]